MNDKHNESRQDEVLGQIILIEGFSYIVISARVIDGVNCQETIKGKMTCLEDCDVLFCCYAAQFSSSCSYSRHCQLSLDLHIGNSLRFYLTDPINGF